MKHHLGGVKWFIPVSIKSHDFRTRRKKVSRNSLEERFGLVEVESRFGLVRLETGLGLDSNDFRVLQFRDRLFQFVVLRLRFVQTESQPKKKNYLNIIELYLRN
jgi:hypothetical protein